MTGVQSEILSGYIADCQRNGWNQEMGPQNERWVTRDGLFIIFLDLAALPLEAFFSFHGWINIPSKLLLKHPCAYPYYIAFLCNNSIIICYLSVFLASYLLIDWDRIKSPKEQFLISSERSQRRVKDQNSQILKAIRT